MNALKFFNIILVALIVTLILQMFTQKPQTQIPENTISISSLTKEVTIPTIPKIDIYNKTTSDFSFNTCENLEISINSINVRSTDFADFCQDITVNAGQTHQLNLTPLANIFTKNFGEYIFRLEKDDIKTMLSVNVENRGFIRSFFSTLIYQPIYNLFAGIIQYLPGHSLGWAIVIITIIFRLILLVPQHKSLESGRRMAEIQPKVRALQEEYKGNPELGLKLLELYKKEGVSPMGPCLPLLIQMPFLMALYWVITDITDISNQFFLYPFLSHFNPTTIDTNFFGVNLLHIGGTIAIIAGLILAFTQWIQSYITYKAQAPLQAKIEKKEPKEGEIPTMNPEILQKMTLYILPFMMGIIALFFPLGLALYTWIGIIFMIAQQAFVNARAKTKKSKGEIVKK